MPGRPPVSRRACVGAIALALASISLPAAAEPAPSPAPLPAPHAGAGPAARFRHLDVSALGKVRLPRGLQGNQTVSALVQLDDAPASIPDGTPGGPDAAKLRRVERSQNVVVPKLRAAGARSYGRLTTVLNAVQVRVKVDDLGEVAAVPGVKAVQVSRVVHVDNAASGRFTGVDRAWRANRLTGRGQTIGVIDTGIDYTHADFGGPGTAKAFTGNKSDVVEPGTFPTAKVTGGYDFVGDDYAPGSSDETLTVPHPDRDPLDCEGHGSHVAGTAAGLGVTGSGRPYPGPYDTATLGRSFRVQPGAAPKATLRAYRVFGCEGSAADDVIVAAIDRAVRDRVDVINLSLGAPFGTRNDLQTQAIDAATRSGVLVVVSAGNSGTGSYLVGTPATADSALAVAAVDAEFPRLPAVAVTGAVTGDAIVANEVAVPSPITGTLVDVGLGCTAEDYAGVRGKIALTTRGVCPRTDRAVLGAKAGARAVIMINSEPGLPPLEGPIPDVHIPFLGVRGSEAARYRAADGRQVTLRQRSPIANPNYRRTADFSSNGPRRLDNAQKPDVAAPGVSVPSVAVGTGTGATRLSGTSMASPHTAGIAALVRQAHPGWSPLQAKAALISTASPGAVADFDSQRVGTGVVSAPAATAAQAYARTRSPLNSLRFGARQLSGQLSLTTTFSIVNRSNRPVTYTLSARFSGARHGARVTFGPRLVRVGAHGSRTVAVRLRLSRAAVTKLPGADGDTTATVLAVRGLVVAKPRHVRAGIGTLSIAFVSVPIPLSDVVATPTVKPTVSGSTARGTIRLRNRGGHSGTAELYDWLLSDPAGDADDPEVADLTDVGVQSLPGTAAGADASDRLLVFAAAEAHPTSTHATREVDLGLDTNGDGEADYYTFAADRGLVTTGTPDGTLWAYTQDSEGNVVDAWTAVAPTNGSTVEIPVLASRIKVTATSGPVAVGAAGFSIVTNGSDEVSGTARFDPYRPALSQGSQVTLAPKRSAAWPVTVQLAQLSRQTHRGWLVVTLDDRGGRAEADRVKLAGLPTRSTGVWQARSRPTTRRHG